jgi:hypothetical protein
MSKDLSVVTQPNESPNTTFPSRRGTSSELFVRKSAPSRCAANDHDEDEDEDDRGEHPATPGVVLGLSLSSLTLVAVSHPQ